MKKLVRESLIDEGVADKFIKKDPMLAGISDEFAEFEKKYAEEEYHQKGLGELFYKSGNFILIKNPSSLNNFGPNVRGVITKNGDLYLEKNSVKVHNDILDILKSKNLIPELTSKRWTRISPKESGFLTVQRLKDTDIIAIGESNKLIYSEEEYEQHLPEYTSFLKLAQKKMPNLKFSNKIIGSKDPNLTKGKNFIKK